MSTRKRPSKRSEPAPKGNPPSSKEEDLKWRSMYLRLVDFQRERGHCDVPPHAPFYRGLASWLNTQRELAAKGLLSAAKVAALTEFGVDLTPEEAAPSHSGSEDYRDSLWELKYAQLVAFKELHGHTRVTKSYDACPGLGHWRHHQRVMYRQGMMTDERKAKLDELGFEWLESAYDGLNREHHLAELWETRFRELVEFKGRFGNCLVVTGWRENPDLAKWVLRQRGAHKKGELRADRARRLEELGFSWESDYGYIERQWERRYAELTAFKEAYGHCRVTKSHQVEWPGLYAWRHHQREVFRAGQLSAAHKERLDSLEFEWEEDYGLPPGRTVEPRGRSSVGRTDVLAAVWEQRYTELEDYQKRFGNCEVASSWKENPALAKWVAHQRTAYRDGELLPERLRRLEALGFAWESTFISTHERWNRRYAELVEFQKQHGHCRVSKTNGKAWPGLYSWRHHQRELNSAGELNGARRSQLDALGFEWEERPFLARTHEPQSEVPWELRFKALVEFKERFGHCMVKTGWPENPTLARWVIKQRIDHTAGHLRPDRKERLDALGFAWSSDYAHLDDAWELRFVELKSFYDNFGHCRVTRSWRVHPGLASWLDHQKERWRTGTLAPERLERLNALGFTEAQGAPISLAHLPMWEDLWQQRIKELGEFKSEFGHTSVPASYDGNPPLGRWVTSVRKKYRVGTLPPERTAELEGLGFAWNPLAGRSNTEPQWEARFKLLQEFHREFGHTRVTEGWEKAPDLWRFRHYQRQLNRQGQLPADRKAQLDSLGFDWEDPTALSAQDIALQAAWLANYQKLIKYYKRNGNARVPKDWKGDPELARWLQRQRRRLKHGTIAPERAAALKILGVERVGG